MNRSRFKLSAIQKPAYQWGLLVCLLTFVVLLLPGFESLHQSGPDNPGHEEMECGECHRATAGYFGYAPTENDQCLSCHDNPDDRHPVAKFAQPEFAQARRAAAVESCSGCHNQHQGRRVSASVQVCQNCHQDTTLDNDPVDLPHTTLIEQARWDTCLGCHDFHGNHDFKAPTMMANQLSEQAILDYLETGESPYGFRRLTVLQTMRERP